MTGPRPAPGDARLIIPGIAEDGSLYPVEKLAAHRRGLRHLAVSVFVFSAGRMLIQRRAAGKYHCAGMWANTCCSHPHWGEAPADCAARRLREEIGLVLPLEERATVEYRSAVTGDLIEHERVHVFEGALDMPIMPDHLNRSEVSEVRWVGCADLRVAIDRRPEDFAPWLRIYLDRWPELQLRSAA